MKRKVYKMILSLSVLSHLIIFVIAQHQLLKTGRRIKKSAW